jgi:hypothetical protein
MTSILLPLGSLAPARCVDNHASSFVAFVSFVVDAFLAGGTASQ